MNFFEIIKPYVEKLTKNEYTLLDYVIKHMAEIQNKSIREVAAACFVSTTTFLRFVRKIGFSGYSEFSTVIKYTVLNSDKKTDPDVNFVEKQSQYRGEYLKNIEETIRVLDERKLLKICRQMAHHPKLYFYAKGFSKYATDYIEYLYTLNDFIVVFPKNFEQRKLAYRNVDQNDLIFVFDYAGEDDELISIIQNLKRHKNYAALVSITGANNNTIQNMSDENLYLFTDELKINQVDMTSHVSLIIIMELLLYQYLEYEKSQES
ncbi:MurR/RpiR family transcriptional regulator [Lentilactobacillus farraginis]|uniref:Phosphosugar-binding protein n=1 Tax=Lentilactobacillus farraginis DSM 18382 = JCM 14108 TaxID=1423743 RepID=X0QED6_9LACO|nr:MurR/RpiR family transcriptional regulator [Lentilactobacillus farraginis]KRM08785.1 RpiR family transcriptional regulator [Lentilactobacillus farraginis DSM 18382 = JCM 14108]GAF36955.1 phosphosugar-binding protein [Lentilactobacillus farraginis DSM 18382 = JCM 14108]